MDAREMAREVARHGAGQDLILAHVSPREAAELAEKYGGDINEHTGLPQFDLWSRIASPFKRVVKEAGRIGNQAYDNTFGKIGGWTGKHIFGSSPIGDYTRHLMTMSAGGAIPFGGAVTGELADYEGQRQMGASEGKAAGGVGRHFGESIAAMAGGELGATYGGDIPGNAGFADWGSMGNSAVDTVSQYGGQLNRVMNLFKSVSKGGSATPQQKQQAVQSVGALKQQVMKEYEPYPEKQAEMQKELDYLDRLVSAIQADHSQQQSAPDAAAQQRAIVEQEE